MWQPAANARRLEAGGCQVWWTRISYERDAQLALLDEAERGRHAALRQPADRTRFVLGCALERIVLGRYLGEAPAHVPIDRTCTECGKPHGKPRLGLAGAPVQFSLSHSGDRVVLAVASCGSVGVDVEAVKDRMDLDGLTSHTLHVREQADFDALDARERTDAFLAYWTRKEAVLKATGEGLRAPMKALVLSAPMDRPRVLAWDDRPTWPERVSLHDLHPGPGYVASLAILDGAPSWIQELDAHDLLA